MITNLQKRSENGLYSLNWFSLFVVNIFSSSNKKLNIFIFLQSLKLSAPVYGLDILYFEIPHWAAVFMPLCNPITYVRELFKPSKVWQHLPVCNERIFFKFWVMDFCGWHCKWGRFRPFFVVEVIGPLVPIAQGKYFAQVFIGS